MASEDSSFNASGSAVVAFETITGPGDRAFGASVSGNVCGVYGQGTQEANSQDDRTSPSATGVLGVGESHGVYGVGSSPALNIGTDAPDFTTEPPSGGIGVIVNQSAGRDTLHPAGSPAILGLNDVLKTDFAAGAPANFSNALTDVTRNQVGVGGLSRLGHGVCGLSLNIANYYAAPDQDKLFDRSKEKDLPNDPLVNGTLEGDVLDPAAGGTGTTHSDAAGVIGIAMNGPGLRGVSFQGRGAIFQSATSKAESELSQIAVPSAPVAQIRLVPHANLTVILPGKEPPLPQNGEIGDLLALAVVDSNRRVRADLWFCVGTDTDTGKAVWGKLAFSDTVIGTA